MATIYKEGSRGAVVKQIQKALKRSGFGVFDDGIWGPITTEALTAFQKAKGLKPDGLAGPATLAKLGIAVTASAVSPQPAQLTVRHHGLLLKRSRRRINYIVVHCTATPEGRALSVEQIRRDHRAQGWADIGYHYVVTLDGLPHLGRDVDIAGSHVKGHNADSIGVAYVGGLENKPIAYDKLKAKDTRTEVQKAELLSLLMDLRKLYPSAKIVGHRDFSEDKNGNGIIDPWERIKECPSFDAKSEYRFV